MKLFHFTHADVDVLKVDRFGDHSWTDNDAEKNKVPRIFFYLVRRPKEWYFNNASFCYVVDIKNSELYDFRKDKDDLRGKFKNDVPAILEYCKENYKGIIYTSGNFDAASLFHDVKPDKKIRRKRNHAKVHN